METKSHIANALEVADEKARYDDCAKKILSNKVILAHIMKDTMAEFKDVPLDTTMQCIEGTPDVGIVPLYPGKEKPEAITGLPTEDIVPNEGEVRYDIRFYAVTPDSHEKSSSMLRFKILSMWTMISLPAEFSTAPECCPANWILNSPPTTTMASRRYTASGL